MAIFHYGMKKVGMNKGRSDSKASKGGHAMFGKSGGGQGGVHTKLMSSPMTPKMGPPKMTSAASGKTTRMAGKKGY